MVLSIAKQNAKPVPVIPGAKTAISFASFFSIPVLKVDRIFNCIISDMKKTFILVKMIWVLSLVSSACVSAQSCSKSAETFDKGKTCEPEKCKPGETKKQEAAVITDIRNELLVIEKALAAKGIGVKVKGKLVAGKHDNESLDLIIGYIESLHSGLATVTGTYSLAFNDGHMGDDNMSKAQLVASIKDYVADLKAWISKI